MLGLHAVLFRSLYDDNAAVCAQYFTNEVDRIESTRHEDC